MRKKQLLLFIIFIISVIKTFAQSPFKTERDVFGKTPKDLVKFSYWINPTIPVPELYILMGVNTINPGIYLNSSTKLKFDMKPPQVQMYHIINSKIYPVWIWNTGPSDTIGAFHVPQWECFYSQDIHQFLNLMEPGDRFFSFPVERIDSTLHSVGGDEINNTHDVKYFLEHGDTLVFSTYSDNISNMICRKAGTLIDLGKFSTDLIDTLQSKLDQLPCFSKLFINKDYHETFHVNSIDVIALDDTDRLVGTSERHTNLIRFAHFILQPDGNYMTKAAFRLGSCNDSFNQVTCINGCFKIEGGHDFRFIKKIGNRILCTYYDNEPCTAGSKDILFMLDPYTQELEILDSIRPSGDQTLASQGTGSSRVILGSDSSAEAIKNAYRIINFTGNRLQTDTTKVYLPILGIDTFFVQQETNPPNEPGGVNIFSGLDHQQVFGLKYGFEPENVLDILAGKLQIGFCYHASAYLPGMLKFPSQPEIECRPFSLDSVELYVIGFDSATIIWSTGDTAATIHVHKNSLKTYLVSGKTDTTMRGWLYSKPFEVGNSSCLVSGISIPQTDVLNIYPNPGSEWINVQKLGFITIFSLLGDVVYQQEIKDKKINISTLSKGLYIVHLIENEKTHIGKFIKQ